MSIRATRSDNEHIPCVMVIGVIDDDPTPKIGGGRTAYTLNSRDHKGMMIVVLGEDDDISESDRQPNGE